MTAMIDLHQPLQQRGGFCHFPARLARGEDSTVVYLGGSITQSGGADGGYRGPGTRWLRERSPGATITEVNAGIGGTASDLGAFRLDRDVLVHKPDLLFVEFAVNDATYPNIYGKGTDHAVAVMEGIVRRVRATRPECDICFVYTLAQRSLDDLHAGRLWHEADMHERVAEHYGLPSINLAFDVTLRLDAGTMQWDEFANDMCHPNENGYTVYGETMVNALEQLVDAAADASPCRTPPAILPSAWHRAGMTSVEPFVADAEGWSWTPMENRGGWECFDGVMQSNKVGSECAFPFTGSTVGLFYHLGPESGDIDWAVDDGPWQTRRVFDSHCTYWRPHYTVLAESLDEGDHTLRVRVSSERDERSAGHELRLAYVLHA